MNLDVVKKNPVFSVCLGLIALLLVGAGAGLVSAYGRYSSQDRDLRGSIDRLQQLNQRNPFPAESNLDREQENLRDVVDKYNELNELLREAQVDRQPMEASDFMPFLERSLRQLRGRLQQARIRFPEGYAFGFEKYAVGQLPASENIPRLVQQLKIMEVFCRMLQDSAVTELTAIKRDEFEQAARGASGGRRGEAGPDAEPEGPPQLVEKQTFTLSFKARESAVVTLLNKLAGYPMFIVVTRLDMTNPRQEFSLAKSAPAEAAGGAQAGSGSRPGADRAVIIGREELDVELDVDVYRFAPSLDFKE